MPGLTRTCRKCIKQKPVPTPSTRSPFPGEVEISSLRVNRRVKDVPQPMAVVGASNFLKLSSQTLSNVLGMEPGIAMGRDGAWSTTINIRGLGENRLVTLVDGHRVETATDLTASFSMIDVNDIERVEVIKGAQSSLYGTGAMGASSTSSPKRAILPLPLRVGERHPGIRGCQQPP